jgi:hypothetical protein
MKPILAAGNSNSLGTTIAVTAPTGMPASQAVPQRSATPVSTPPIGTLWEHRSRILQCDSVNALMSYLAESLTATSLAGVAWSTATTQTADAAIDLTGLPASGTPAGLFLKTAMQQAAATCVETGNAARSVHQAQPPLVVVALAVPVAARPVIVLAGSQPDLSYPDQRLLQSLLSEWAVTRRCRTAERVSDQVAAVAELMRDIQASDSVDVAALKLSEGLRDYLHASRVAVGLCRAGSKRCRLAALSDQSSSRPSPGETAALESVLQESIARGQSAVWPQSDDSQRHALLSHQQLCRNMDFTSVVTAPLFSDPEQPCGAIAVMFGAAENESPGKDQQQNAWQFLNASATPLAACLTGLQKLADSWLLNTVRRWRQAMTIRRLRAATLLAAAVCGLALIPLPHDIDCNCELQPTTRRFVAAPFEAPLQKCCVKPGDVVTADQLLAVLDGRELRWELAGVEAELNQARKERNTFLNTHDTGEAVIALHEVERLTSRADLLQNRTDNLEICSPIDGIVVAGDHEDSVGIPLEMGQSLFEIAPLDSMIVELEIPEEDIRHVQPGQTFRMQLNADPANPLSARILRIHPRAELSQNENVFIAEAEIENSTGTLRPGMKGKLKSRPDSVPSDGSCFTSLRHDCWAGWGGEMPTHHDPTTIELSQTCMMLRNDMEVSTHVSSGQHYWHLSSPDSSEYFRIGWPEYVFLSFLDGHTRFCQALALAARVLGAQAVTEADATRLYQWLIRSQLGTLREHDSSASAVPPRGEADPLTRWGRNLNPFWMRLPLGCPEKLLKTLSPLGEFLLSPAACLVSIALMLVAAFRLLQHSQEFFGHVQQVAAPQNWLWLLIAWVLLKIIHELGHGLACRHYGGKVPSAGIAFVLFTPMAWLDASACWAFPSRWRRIVTAAAGMYAELTLASLAVIIWTESSDPGCRR